MKFLKSKYVFAFFLFLLVVTPTIVYFLIQSQYQGEMSVVQHAWVYSMVVVIIVLVLFSFEQMNKHQPYYPNAKAYLLNHPLKPSVSKLLVIKRWILYIALMAIVMLVLTVEWIFPNTTLDSLSKMAIVLSLLVGYFWVVRMITKPYNKVLYTYSMNHDIRLLYEVYYVLSKGIISSGVKTRINLLRLLLMFYIIEDDEEIYQEIKQNLTDYVRTMNAKTKRIFHEFIHKRYELYRLMYKNNQQEFITLYEQLLEEEDELLLIIPKRITLLSLKIKEGDVAVDYYNMLQGELSNTDFTEKIYQSVLAKTLQASVLQK